MKLVYVTRSVVTEARFAMIISDEVDLKRQLAEAEVAFRATAFNTKPQKDKQGNLVTHQLSKDWHPYP